MAEIPSRLEIQAWLRKNVQKKPPGIIARCFGVQANFRYDISEPRSVRTFFKKCVLFEIHGEKELLPIVSLPGGSRGYFALVGDELFLLAPGNGSFERILRIEEQSFDEVNPKSFAKLVCDVHLMKDCQRHAIVESVASLRSFSYDHHHGYQVSETELDQVGSAIVPPSITPCGQSGWRLEFTEVFGWMHKLNSLGVTSIVFDRNYSVSVGEPKLLSKQIFREVPGVIY